MANQLNIARRNLQQQVRSGGINQAQMNAELARLRGLPKAQLVAGNAAAALQRAQPNNLVRQPAPISAPPQFSIPTGEVPSQPAMGMMDTGPQPWQATLERINTMRAAGPQALPNGAPQPMDQARLDAFNAQLQANPAYQEFQRTGKAPPLPGMDQLTNALGGAQQAPNGGLGREAGLSAGGFFSTPKTAQMKPFGF